MNLNFTKVGIGRAENEEGSIVRGYAPEMLIYEREGFSLVIDINYAENQAVIYRPRQDIRPPTGISKEEMYSEILAGARLVARRDVVWGL